ncbi:MAG: rhamnogalacturonate lyase, partial [Prevotellaceae bacterium]|nr:rhamnogalacturonate lyase [Prevotellaceae bacterium]
FFFGAPYLDGRHASIFLARGIYTRHKMIAYDVDPDTHTLKQRWAWNCNSSGPWYGQGYHNYSIADVDWDGRDEIIFGSMIIDDNGKGLSTSGLGHGDSHHVGDFDPYTHGQEFYGCNESSPSNNYRDATTSKIRYRLAGGSDDGRAMAGNFCNDFPGAMAFSAHDTPISCVADGHVDGLVSNDITMNCRIYWDGDLQEESFNGTEVRNSTGAIWKYKSGMIKQLTGSLTNNDTKATPCYQGDILGDWREEVMMRTADNKIRIYATTDYTPWRNYTLWHDHQYRNAMVWQMCGYNQTPHASYFLGQMEGITAAPPALTMTGKEEVSNGGTISGNDKNLIVCETNDMTVNVSEGASPYMLTVNTPTWVQGSAPSNATASSYNITYSTYTHTFTGGAFTGDMRLVKQGDGIMVLPNVEETYTGNTDIWAGVMNFDGTMKNSHVWLNRLTELNTNGGKFMRGIKMDYGSILRPGNADNKGYVEVDTLALGFGAKVVLDIYGQDLSADSIKCNVLSIEKKNWKGGPAYSAPVFQFKAHIAEGATAIADGKYLIGEINKVEGNLEDIIIEGMSNQKTSLTLEDGRLYLNVKNFTAGHLTWTGKVNGTWDIDKTKNFVDDEGNECTFTPGSSVTFDDNATTTTITIAEPVAPTSITFNNTTKKAFTITGDSIVGEPIVDKVGNGNVTINNINRTGKTEIKAGKMMVATFANSIGNEYGGLGGVKKIITLQDGAILSATQTTTCGQMIKVGSGTAKLDVASGKTLTLEQGLKQAGGYTFDKTGAGTLNIATGQTITKLIITNGTVNAVDNSLPATVEFQGGTLYDANTQNSYNSTTCDFVVPEGKTGKFYADPRCNYTGKLTGGGTFYVYAAGVRNYFNGNWSAFTGTLIPGLSKRASYDPVFDFNNTYGIPNATMKLNADVTVQNDGKNFAIGNISGEGTLAGTGTWTIGQAVGEGQTFNMAASSSSPIIKKGKGEMRIITPGKLTGTLTIQEGAVRVSKNSEYLNGTKLTTITGATSRLYGPAKMYSVTVSNGGTLAVTSILGLGATTEVTNTVTVNAGANLEMVFDKATPSRLNTATMKLLGNVKIGADGYTPSDGDSFNFWNCKTFSKSTTTSISLPELEGYEYDTSSLWDETGSIRVVKVAAPLGDANDDGVVDVADITTIAAFILGNEPDIFNMVAADANEDGNIDVADITATANIILINAKRKLLNLFGN